LCCQGNRGIVSHRGDGEFAYDFAMPVGSDVCAARAGVVKWVEVGNDGNGRHAPNNFVVIEHGDGTFGWYLHIRREGSYVQPNQRVRQGERIAASGNVGLSMLPHLHFQVSNSRGESLPVTFTDVDSDRGIPRMFKRYTSGNSP
jgi:murein DD-endopeptidase MepM/ murein hydrolase activator NlpD